MRLIINSFKREYIILCLEKKTERKKEYLVQCILKLYIHTTSNPNERLGYLNSKYKKIKIIHTNICVYQFSQFPIYSFFKLVYLIYKIIYDLILNKIF